MICDLFCFCYAAFHGVALCLHDIPGEIGVRCLVALWKVTRCWHMDIQILMNDGGKLRAKADNNQFNNQPHYIQP